MHGNAEFFQELERQMRRDASLAGRDHLLYRGYYGPVKGVVDGDLCERFRLLDGGEKGRIAARLGREVGEVERKISVLSPFVCLCLSV